MADSLPSTETFKSEDDPSSQRPILSWFSKLFRGSSSGQGHKSHPPRSPSQQAIISAANKFHLLRVEDVMVPRADIVAVDVLTGLHDLTLAFEEAGHSRLPVYQETLDDPIGMVHIKDMLSFIRLDAKGRSKAEYRNTQIVQEISRDVLFVPPSMRAQDLLRRMQAKRIHMAIVVDEYGGTDGIVTLEDLVEQIVGDIEDEHDEDDVEVKTLKTKTGQTYWEADARVNIDDFETVLGRDFASQDEEDDVDTLGGLIFTLAGRVPERGEIIPHESGLEFEVIDADPRRVKRLRIQMAKTDAP